MSDAGITDTLIVHHMGHIGERARGDSRLEDWPDAIWRIAREDADPASPRYFTAYGRDVSVPEGRLTYDESTRQLTYVAGSRTDAKTDAAHTALIALLAADAKAGGEGQNKTAIEAELGAEHARGSIRAAITKAVKAGHVVIGKGRAMSKPHRIARPCQACGYPVTDPNRLRHFSCDEAAEEPL